MGLHLIWTRSPNTTSAEFPPDFCVGSCGRARLRGLRGSAGIGRQYVGCRRHAPRHSEHNQHVSAKKRSEWLWACAGSKQRNFTDLNAQIIRFSSGNSVRSVTSILLRVDSVPSWARFGSFFALEEPTEPWEQTMDN